MGNISTKVKVSYDPEIRKAYLERVKQEKAKWEQLTDEEKASLAKEKKHQEYHAIDKISQSKSRELALSQSVGKDERKFKLTHLIKKGEVQTVQAAAQTMGLADSTITKYLRELNITLYDTKKKKMPIFNTETRHYLSDDESYETPNDDRTWPSQVSP